MITLRFGAVATALGFLTACGSGGGGSSALAPSRSAARTTTATVRIVVPARTGSSTARGAKFVSASTNGVLVQVFAHSDAAHANLLGSSATDISSGAAACGGATGFPRTCVVSVPAPAGADDFVFASYDQPPVNGSFSGANQLAAGTVANQTIIADTLNTVNATLGGIVTTLGAPARVTVSADLAPAQYAIAFGAQDAGGNTIVGTYSSPIAVTLNETSPDVTHMGLFVNGTFVGTSATLNSSSDTLAVIYDGQGGPSDFGVVALASGSANANVAFDPFFITSASPLFESGPNPVLHFNAQGRSATVTFSENGATFTNTTLDASSCSGIAAVAGFSNGQLTVTASAAGQCAIYVGDPGNLTVRALTVNDTFTSSSITVP
jgi:hypothetical protein